MSEPQRQPFRFRLAVLALATLLALPAAHGALAHDLAGCASAGDGICGVAGRSAAPDAPLADELCPWCLVSSQARTWLRPSAAGQSCEPAGAVESAAPESAWTPTPRARGLCAPRAPPSSH